MKLLSIPHMYSHSLTTDNESTHSRSTSPLFVTILNIYSLMLHNSRWYNHYHWVWPFSELSVKYVLHTAQNHSLCIHWTLSANHAPYALSHDVLWSHDHCQSSEWLPLSRPARQQPFCFHFLWPTSLLSQPKGGIRKKHVRFNLYHFFCWFCDPIKLFGGQRRQNRYPCSTCYCFCHLISRFLKNAHSHPWLRYPWKTTTHKWWVSQNM